MANSPASHHENSAVNHRPLIIAIAILALVIGWLTLASGESKNPPAVEASYLPVTVVNLAPQVYQVELQVTGVTQPRWLTGLVSSVTARVKNLPAGLEPGALVDADQMLLELEATALQANYDEAQSRLAEAELNLQQTLHEQTVALGAGGNRKTAYGRFEPQVKAARQQVVAAKALLANALHELNNTRLNAPFPGIILQRSVTPGQWIQAGETVFQLAARDSIDVKTELTDKHWQQLSGRLDSIQVNITSREDQWPATIRYIDPVRDPNTRQRSLVLKVEQPYEAGNGRQTLLPDTQVEVKFSGQQVSQVVICPASVLTEDGKVWTLDRKNQLRLESVELIQQSLEQVVVRFNQSPAEKRNIVLYPLASMIEGQRVSPQSVSFSAAIAQGDVL